MADRTDMERDKPFRSLRLEFAVLFFALMAGAVAVMFLTNNVFLERYYNQEKQDTLEETYERLNTAASSNSIESIAFGNELIQISNRNNINILVIDEESKTVRAMATDMDTMLQRMWDNILENTNELPDDFDEHEVQLWQEDRQAPDYYIVKRLQIGRAHV